MKASRSDRILTYHVVLPTKPPPTWVGAQRARRRMEMFEGPALDTWPRGTCWLVGRLVDNAAYIGGTRPFAAFTDLKFDGFPFLE